MDNNGVKLTDINFENKDQEDMYQFQLEQNNNYGYLVHIGYMENNSDVLISKFTIDKSHICTVISCLYTENDINNLYKNGIYPLIKVNCYKIENEKYIITDSIMYCFCTKYNILNNKSINNKIKINGDLKMLHQNSNSLVCILEEDVNISENIMIENCIKQLAEIIY